MRWGENNSSEGFETLQIAAPGPWIGSLAKLPQWAFDYFFLHNVIVYASPAANKFNQPLSWGVIKTG